jgi:hypothetical protein
VVKSTEASTSQWAARKVFQVDWRLRCGAGLDAVSLEDVGDRCVRYAVPQIRQGPLNPIIAPGRTLLGDMKHQLDDLRRNKGDVQWLSADRYSPSAWRPARDATVESYPE